MANPYADVEGVGEVLEKETIIDGPIYREIRSTVGMDNDNEKIEVTHTENMAGDYIGDDKTARYLVEDNGIVPELADPEHRTCSIGYSEKDGQWYGWSHRAIHGFKTGDKLSVKKSSVLRGKVPDGYEVKDAEDAKRIATIFAGEVS